MPTVARDFNRKKTQQVKTGAQVHTACVVSFKCLKDAAVQSDLTLNLNTMLLARIPIVTGTCHTDTAPG